MHPLPEKNIQSETGTLFAALSYLWLFCLVPLLLKRGDEFVAFHARQGLVLFMLEVIGWAVYWIPFIGGVVIAFFVIVSAIGFYKALTGQRWRLPLVAALADRIRLG